MILKPPLEHSPTYPYLAPQRLEYNLKHISPT